MLDALHKCDACNRLFVMAQLIKCKNYEVCEGMFCFTCATTNLDADKLCEYCRTVWCAECPTEIECHDDITCVMCGIIFCATCAQFMLDHERHCPEHSSKKTAVCAYCEKIIFLENSTACAGCHRKYCAECFSKRTVYCYVCNVRYCVFCQHNNEHVKNH